MTNSQGEEAGKLFVGGLSWETTQENLHHYFSRFGEVVDCVVMKNSETGRSRGFGFVTFKDPSCVSVVLSSGPHELDGRTIDPKSCSPRGMQKPKKSGNYPKIFLGGLPSSCTETDLRNFFSKYGKVVEVVIMFDQENKKSRGFGFLSFESEDSIEQVCSEHYVNINGKQVECKRAEPRDTSRNFKNNQQQPNQQQPNQWGGPGMGMGGPGGWGPGPMGPGGPSGPGMGPGPGVPAGPMGPSVANGMMPGGYQGGGWGGPQQQGPYGPQGGYGGYQGWGAPSAGFGPYPGPGPQYGQQGYGYGNAGTPGAPGFGGYSGFGAPMGGAPAPGGPPGVQSGGPEMYNQAGPVGPAGSAPGQGNQPPGTAAGAPAGPKNDFGYNNPYGAMGNYPQESSSFGPSRGGYGGGPGGGFGAQGSGPHGMGGSGAGAGVAGGGGPQGGGSGFGRGSAQSQGYHPYRRV